ncbi:hypothetical protein [Marinobacter salarius]|uniref:hypothetical protein n=1 Tax=Marinobacter salarius TaxID=1420917 RepID=UPI003D9C2F6E
MHQGRRLLVLIFIASVLLVGCRANETQVARIEISPGFLTLNVSSPSKSLRVDFFDEDGNRIASTSEVNWTSSNPEIVSVDDEGVVRGAGVVGSSVLFAEVGGVKSDPITVLFADLAPGAVALSDSQFIEPPRVYWSAGEKISPGDQFRVAVDPNTDLQLGDVVLSSEKLPVGGRVVEITRESDRHILILELVPVREMYSNIRLNQSISLGEVQPKLSPSVSDYYTLRKDGDRTIFELKSFAHSTKGLSPEGHIIQIQSSAVETFSDSSDMDGFFTCDTSENMDIPLSVSLLPSSVSLSQDLFFDLNYDEITGGLQKMSVRGNVEATFETQVSIELQRGGSFLTCEAELVEIPLPIGGPLSLFFGGAVPLGVAFEMGGEANFANIGARLNIDARSEIEVGFICSAAGSNCQTISEAAAEVKSDFNWDIPSEYQMRIEPYIEGNGFARLSLGSRLLKKQLRWDTLIAKYGSQVTSSFARTIDQIVDEDYRSGYELNRFTSLGPDVDALVFLNFFKLNLPSLELQTSEDIVSSPKLASFRTDKDRFQAGDLVNLEIELDPETLDFFPGIYNVSKLHIFRSVNTESPQQLKKVVTLEAQDAQRVFYYGWTAPDPGTASDELFAFVETKLFENYFYGNFELGKAKTPSTNPFLLVADDYNDKIVEMSPDFSEVIDIKATESHLGKGKDNPNYGITNFSVSNGTVAYVAGDGSLSGGFSKFVIGDETVVSGANDDFWFAGANDTLTGVVRLDTNGANLDLYDHDGNSVRSIDYSCGGRLEPFVVFHPEMTETHFAFVALDHSYGDYSLAFASLDDGSCQWIHRVPQTHGNNYKVVGESVFYGDLVTNNKIVQMDLMGNVENQYTIINSGYVMDFVVAPEKSIIVFRRFEDDSFVDIYEWDNLILSFSKTINLSEKFNMGKVWRAELDSYSP